MEVAGSNRQNVVRPGRQGETVMTYGDGIWLIGFLLTFLMERPIIVKEKHSTRDMDEKKVDQKIGLEGVICKVGRLFYDLGVRNSGQ